MSRLQVELDRLYGNADGHGDGIRTLVLELALPASWTQLVEVWKGVQADLDLPAPAIAVSGVDALQLWFCVASPVAQDMGARFLDGLRARYLPDVAPSKVRLITQPSELPPLPPIETGPDHWSAFLAPDLVSVFADAPWLDIPPSEEGQAALLRATRPMPLAAFEAALSGLAESASAAAVETPALLAGEASSSAAHDSDAARFLACVMHDESVPMALRIEAAKALLTSGRR